MLSGSTYAATTGYRRNQQYVGTDDIGKQSAVAQDLPYGTTVYAEVSVHVQCSMFYEHIIIISISIGPCKEYYRSRSILRNSYCCR